MTAKQKAETVALIQEQMAQARPRRGKLTFSKNLALWTAICINVFAIASYVLAALGLYSNESLTICIVTAGYGFLVTYAAKSAFEKDSRNKTGVDENGVPWENREVKSYEDTAG